MRMVRVTKVELSLSGGELDAAAARALRDELNAVFPQEEAVSLPAEEPLFGAPPGLVGQPARRPPADTADALDGITGDAGGAP